MQTYEAMLIFKPGLKEEEQKVLVKELEKKLKENQAIVENSELFGKRVLSYEINKYSEGLYYLINFSTQNNSTASKLQQACNINENILRTLIVKKESKAKPIDKKGG